MRGRIDDVVQHDVDQQSVEEGRTTTGAPHRWARAPLAAVIATLLAAGVVAAGIISSSGRAAGDAASPVPAVRPFTLPPVIDGAAPVALPRVPGHPVVLTFFASWCAPCTRELPVIERAFRSGVPVVGVDELDQRPDGPDLVRRTGVTFPSGYDHSGSVGRDWAVDGLPITVFIDAAGRVVDYHRGELTQHQLDQLVARLDGGRE